jgi:GH35 family endo-1,4-beta-xylanase
MAPVAPAFAGVSAKELEPFNPDRPDAAVVARRIAEAGVVRVGNKVHWELLEPERGEPLWDLYDQRFADFAAQGLEPVVTLRGTAPWASSQPGAERPELFPPERIEDWTAFVDAVVRRYSPWVRDWEIWNEPNGDDYFLGTPGDYVDLLNAAYPVIKAADPGATVWAPAVAFHPWSDDALAFVEQVVATGRFDVLSLHLYFSSAAEMVATVEQVRDLLSTYGRGDVPLRITEVNRVESITDCEGFSDQPPAEHAAALAGILACLANAGVEQVLWFKATDTSQRCADGRRLRNGLLDEWLEPKAPYWTLAGIVEGLVAATRIFADGFESGDLSGWSGGAEAARPAGPGR